MVGEGGAYYRHTRFKDVRAVPVHAHRQRKKGTRTRLGKDVPSGDFPWGVSGWEERAEEGMGRGQKRGTSPRLAATSNSRTRRHDRARGCSPTSERL